MDIRRAEVELRINGQVFEEWSSVSIIRSIDQINHTFSMTYRPRGDARGVTKFRHKQMDICEVYEGGKLLISGYLSLRPDVGSSGDSYYANISGESVTGQLVAGFNISKPRIIRKKSIVDILNILTEFYPIEVKTHGSNENLNKKLKVFKFQEGERVFDTIKRASAMAGIHVWTLDGSQLIAGVPGQRRPIGEIGNLGVLRDRNLSGGSAQRYSEYITASKFAKDLFGDSRSKRVVSVKDDEVSLFIPYLMRARGKADLESMERQARQAMHVRRGQAVVANFKFHDWRMRNGAHWTPGDLIQVNDDEVLELREEMIISAVQFDLSEGSQTCVVELKRKEVYDTTLPPKGREKDSSVGW